MQRQLLENLRKSLSIDENNSLRLYKSPLSLKLQWAEEQSFGSSSYQSNIGDHVDKFLQVEGI